MKECILKSFIFLIILVMCSCGNTKYLASGEHLYIGGEVEIKDDSLSSSYKKDMKAELEDLLRPYPNKTILGMRMKLFFYNLAGDPKKESGIRNWIRTKMGEPPVLVSQLNLESNESILKNRTENKGFFNSLVESDTLVKDKKVKAVYSLYPKEQYKIKDVSFVNDSTPLHAEIDKIFKRTRLRKGRAYDLDVIKEERNRIDSRLKEKGYYFFSPNHILVQVDSTVGTHEVDLIVRLKQDVPQEAKASYTVDNIVVFADYSLSDDVDFQSLNDAYSYNDFLIVDPTKRFRPQIYDRALYFKKGEVYNRSDHNLSLNRLVNLGVFKFVKNQFVISDSVNHKLDSYYYLTPDKPKSVRLELLGKTNSASYTGSELNVNWSNKNFLKGAELFQVSAYGGMDFQMSSKNKGFNVFKYGTEVSLTWPRIVAPFKFHSSSSYVPKTRISLGYEYLRRTKLYTLHSFKGAFGYNWKENVRKEHELNVFEINYVSPENVTDLYIEQATGNPSMEKILDKQLIFGPTYTYTYTNTMNVFKKRTIYYKGSLDLSANITGLIMGANADKGEVHQILGVDYSQYAKTEHDFRYYRKLSRTSQIIGRIHAGIGLPYGNSQQLPYIKQFVVGGTNSVRAFRARALGPGSFDPTASNSRFVPDQAGDILIEMNVEYRKKLAGIVHGALFMDAGNIWLLDETSDRPGGTFSKDFYKELAVGVGAGLRFDITFLVVRFDLAFPIRVPYFPEGDRWTLDKISLGSKEWRKDNLMFNLAIGYPF
ncbi:translocation and assembly module lipoprotein TamL [Myroides guanonis]|uniref:Outer membrane protein assembly factor BamA n=1 Tax=Myroides guanonis TaxID=1150112 RepID=A0A1I3UV56_9FLAO|nr:BamA/TamA family outer membrane protein [Myroides guanonis]SFJ86915.1 Outer membrane protein assembly factor BamA [Myroides guanonis]